MTSPILLGGTQVCERALAHDMHTEPGGAWVASGVTGRVGLIGHSFTVVNPNGAVVHGIADLSCYTSIAGTEIQGSTILDSAGQVIWGLLTFNTISEHTPFSYAWAYSVGPGPHSIGVGIWIAAGSINFDGNDGGTSSLWERP